jgi:hypothetical protein
MSKYVCDRCGGPLEVYQRYSMCEWYKVDPRSGEIESYHTQSGDIHDEDVFCPACNDTKEDLMQNCGYVVMVAEFNAGETPSTSTS